MVKVSVIVPIYNSEKYLKRCLDSLIGQTLDDIEIILINDGSTDNSEGIIQEYVEKYKDKIKYISQKNSGQAVARNIGIKVATGEYIAFVDSDDYIEKDTYEILYNKATENKCDILCFNLCMDMNGKIEKNTGCVINPENIVSKYIINEASPCNKIIKRKIFAENKLGFLEDHIYEDLALIPTLALYTDKICYSNEYLYYYNIHEDSTMRQKKFNSKMLDIYYAMEYLYEKFSNSNYIDELEYLYIEHLLHAASLRFLVFQEGEKEIAKIAGIIKEKFPNWKNNEYFKKQNIKYRIVCSLLYYNKCKLVKKLLRIGG